MIRFAIVLIVFAASIVACSKKGPSLDEEIKQWSPKVEGKLASIEKIANGLAQVDGTKPFPGSKLQVFELVHKTGNTLITYPADLQALVADKTPPTDFDRHSTSVDVVQCWHVMKKKEAAGFALSNSTYGDFETMAASGGHVAMMCDELAVATHLAVVTPGIKQGANVPLPDDSAKMAESFKGGKTSGIIDVFDLATGAHVGRTAFAAQSSGSVDYESTTTGAGAAHAAEQALDKDLREKTWRAIEDAIEKR